MSTPFSRTGGNDRRCARSLRVPDLIGTKAIDEILANFPPDFRPRIRGWLPLPACLRNLPEAISQSGSRDRITGWTWSRSPSSSRKTPPDSGRTSPPFAVGDNPSEGAPLIAERFGLDQLKDTRRPPFLAGAGIGGEGCHVGSVKEYVPGPGHRSG